MKFSLASRQLVLLGVAAMVAGCAAVGPAGPEQQVQERANAFWQARIKGDVPAAYNLLVPAYRGMRSEDDYARSNGKQIAVKKIDVTKVTCEEQKCVARIAMLGRPSVPGLNLPELTTYMDDVWVLGDGQWWRFQAP